MMEHKDKIVHQDFSLSFIFKFSPLFLSSLYTVFLLRLQNTYNLIGSNHITAGCGDPAEATGYLMVCVHNGPLMCFLSLKVQQDHSHIQGVVLLSCEARS